MLAIAFKQKQQQQYSIAACNYYSTLLSLCLLFIVCSLIDLLSFSNDSLLVLRRMLVTVVRPPVIGIIYCRH